MKGHSFVYSGNFNTLAKFIGKKSLWRVLSIENNINLVNATYVASISLKKISK